MERTKKPNEGKILWLKTDGTFRLPDRRLIRRGETFWASLDEIPVNFRDTIKPVNPKDLEALEKAAEPTKPKDIEGEVAEFIIKERESPNWYDIIDSQGKVVNTKALRHDQALEQLEALKNG